jgi:hypothetical protein
MLRRLWGEMVAIALIGLSALVYLFWLVPTYIPAVRAFGGSDPAPRFVPMAIGVGILLVLAGRVLRVLIRPEPDPQPMWEGTYVNKATAIIALTFVYGFFAVGYLGFYISSTIMAVACMLVLGERRLHMVLLVTAIVLLGIYALFERALGVFMPAGQLVNVSRLVTELFR